MSTRLESRRSSTRGGRDPTGGHTSQEGVAGPSGSARTPSGSSSSRLDTNTTQETGSYSLDVRQMVRDTTAEYDADVGRVVDTVDRLEHRITRSYEGWDKQLEVLEDDFKGLLLHHDSPDIE